MKKLISALLCAILIISSAIPAAAAETPQALLNAAITKTAALESRDYVITEKQSMPDVSESGATIAFQYVNKGANTFDMHASFSSSYGGEGIPLMDIYYLDLAGYLDLFGMKIKSDIPLIDLQNMKTEYDKMANFAPSVMNNVKAEKSGANTVITYTSTADGIKSLTDTAVTGVTYQDIAGTAVIDANGYLLSHTVAYKENHAMGTQSLFFNKTAVITNNAPGQVVQITKPDLTQFLTEQEWDDYLDRTVDDLY